MAALSNKQWEEFARGIALGKSQSRALVEAGYRARNASAVACRLAKRKEIQERVAELTRIAPEMREQAAKVSRAWVLAELTRLAQKAETEGQLSVARQCIRDIGEHLGMFDRRTTVKFDWSGDPAELSEEQLKTLELAQWRSLGWSPERIQQERRKLYLEAGLTIDVEAETVDSEW